MDQSIAYDADIPMTLIPLSPETEVNKVLARINEKLKQLKSIGLTKGDRGILENRLSSIWGEPKELIEQAQDSDKLRMWRHNRARQVYREIQDANDHVFLAVILVITPTECVKTSFRKVLNHVVGLNNYEPYRLNLGSDTKRFFESISVQQGFVGSPYYLRFIESVFPQELRQIKFAYTLVRSDDFTYFLETVLEGIYTSQQWKNERMQGAKTSGAATIFIPTEGDGSCNIVVDRKVLTKAIHKFGLSDLRLE